MRPELRPESTVARAYSVVAAARRPVVAWSAGIELNMMSLSMAWKSPPCQGPIFGIVTHSRTPRRVSRGACGAFRGRRGRSIDLGRPQENGFAGA
jgi:hypothetical protein